MSVHKMILAAILSALTTACTTLAPVGAYGPAPSSAFRAEDFGWSTRSGQASIEGRVAYVRDGQTFNCTGSAGLTPDTPYTRARFQTLYGSTERAAIPEAVVRTRSVADSSADYRSYVRSIPCDGGRFSFAGLPDGSWFVIAPVSNGADRLVLMKRVETRGGRLVNVVL